MNNAHFAHLAVAIVSYLTYALRSMDLDEGDHSQLLRVYYARLFPFKRFYRWLSYGNGTRCI